MAQNEMKAKPALPERVRSMEGLGVIAFMQRPEGLGLLEVWPELRQVLPLCMPRRGTSTAGHGEGLAVRGQ